MPAVQVLEVSGCSITDPGAAALCAVLPSLAQLTRLNLSNNSAGAATCGALAAALQSSGRPLDVSLAACGVHDEPGAALIACLAAAGRWWRLDLCSNALAGGAALVAAHVVRQVLAAQRQQPAGEPAAPQRQLLLDSNPLGGSGVAAIMQAAAGRLPLPFMPPPPAAEGLDRPPLPALHVSCCHASLATGALGVANRQPQRQTLLDSVASDGHLQQQQQQQQQQPCAVITEAGQGFDSSCPAGAYQLRLAHPASRVLMEQLLDLQQRLQQLASQAAGLQQGACISFAGAARAVICARHWRRHARMQGSPAHGAAGSAHSSKRSTQEHDQQPASSSSSGGGSGVAVCAAPPPRTTAPVGVEQLAFADVRLDGRPATWQAVVQAAPWQQQPLAGMGGTGTSRAADKAGSKAKQPQELQFTVKAAAVLVSAEPPVLPGQLLAWCLQVGHAARLLLLQGTPIVMAVCTAALWQDAAPPGNAQPSQRSTPADARSHTSPWPSLPPPCVVTQHLRHRSAAEAWKLRLVELLMGSWLLTATQALQLLACFDQQLGREEQVCSWHRCPAPGLSRPLSHMHNVATQCVAYYAPRCLPSCSPETDIRACSLLPQVQAAALLYGRLVRPVQGLQLLLTVLTTSQGLQLLSR